MNNSVSSIYNDQSIVINSRKSGSKENEQNIKKLSRNVVFSDKNLKNDDYPLLFASNKNPSKNNGFDMQNEMVNIKENLSIQKNGKIYENESQIYEWERSRQMFNECDSKKCQMTPNLRRNMQFKRSLFSCHKQMDENSVNTDRKFRAKMLLTQKKKQKIISEFTLFSEIKNDSNKSIKNNKKTSRINIKKSGSISKNLFKKKLEAQKVTIHRTKRIKKKSDLRFIKKNNVELKRYNFIIKQENELINKIRKTKKKLKKNSFLADALKGLSYNTKLLLKNNLRKFFKNIRKEFFEINEKKSQVSYQFKPKIDIQNETKNLNKNKKKKIRKIKESPTKVLDAPGIIDDFYTHTLEVSSNGILFISLNNTVYSFNLSNNKTQKIKTSFTSSPSSIKISPNGSKVAIGDIKGNLNLIDIEKNCYLFKNKVHNGRLGNISYLNHQVMVTGGKDSCLNIIDLREKHKQKLQSKRPQIALISR